MPKLLETANGLAKELSDVRQLQCTGCTFRAQVKANNSKPEVADFRRGMGYLWKR